MNMSLLEMDIIEIFVLKFLIAGTFFFDYTYIRDYSKAHNYSKAVESGRNNA